MHAFNEGDGPVAPDPCSRAYFRFKQVGRKTWLISNVQIAGEKLAIEPVRRGDNVFCCAHCADAYERRTGTGQAQTERRGAKATGR